LSFEILLGYFDSGSEPVVLEFWSLYFVICPSTGLRVVSPSTLLRTVSLSNGLSNRLEFEYCHLGFFKFQPGKGRTMKTTQVLQIT
jgi:hypothetical protein